MAAESKEQTILLQCKGFEVWLLSPSHLIECNFPLSTAGWGEQRFCPQRALRISLCGDGEGRGTKERGWRAGKGPLTLCPLSLASVHPAWERVVLGEQQSSWAGQSVTGLDNTRDAWPGNGARLGYFPDYYGPQYTFLSPVQAGNSIALSIWMWARVWYEEHVERSWKDPCLCLFLPWNPSPQLQCRGLWPGNLEAEEREGASSPLLAYLRPPWKGRGNSLNKGVEVGLARLLRAGL